MSKSFLFAAAVALAALGVIPFQADAQQQAGAAAKRFAPVMPVSGQIAGTQSRPNKPVASAPRSRPLKAPQIPNNWQPELQPPAFGSSKKQLQRPGTSVANPPPRLDLKAPRIPNSWQPELQPAAFGPQTPIIPKAKIADYVPAPISANKPNPANGPSKAMRATKQRPMGPGHQPAGNPWIAKNREIMPHLSVNESALPRADHRNRRLDQIANSRIDPAIRDLKLGADARNGRSALGQFQPAQPAGNLTGRFPTIQGRPAGPAGNAAPAIGNRGFAADGPGPNSEQQELIWEGLFRDSQGPEPTVFRMDNYFYTINPDEKTHTYHTFNDEGGFSVINEATSREVSFGPHGERLERVVLDTVNIEGSPNSTEPSEKKGGSKHSPPGAEGTDGLGVAGGGRLPERVDRAISAAAVRPIRWSARSRASSRPIPGSSGRRLPRRSLAAAGTFPPRRRPRADGAWRRSRVKISTA